MGVSVFYVTAADEAEAERIARTVVEERLAACANLLGSIRSFYHWEGTLQVERECAFLLKTVDDRKDALIARVCELHSYACPCIVEWGVDAGNLRYLEWVAGEMC